MTIDATPGGASSDAYCTVAEADAYHSNRLHNDEWAAASDAVKEAAIKWATQLLDQYDWDGTKASTTQALRWPRSYVMNRDDEELADDAIPAFLRDACAEFAWSLLKEDRTADKDSGGLDALSVGSVSLDFGSYAARPKLPPSVKDMIRYYYRGGTTLLRV